MIGKKPKVTRTGNEEILYSNVGQVTQPQAANDSQLEHRILSHLNSDSLKLATAGVVLGALGALAISQYSTNERLKTMNTTIDKNQREIAQNLTETQNVNSLAEQNSARLGQYGIALTRIAEQLKDIQAVTGIPTGTTRAWG